MPHRLLSGIAASPAPQDAKERALHDLENHPKPPRPISEMSDQELAQWTDRCGTGLVDSDMTYLVAGNNRAHWFLQLQDAERELARRRRG